MGIKLYIDDLRSADLGGGWPGSRRERAYGYHPTVEGARVAALQALDAAMLRAGGEKQ